MIYMRIWAILLFVALVGCSKDNDLPSGDSEALIGIIYYENFDGFLKIDLGTRVKTLLTTTDNDYNWHIPADGNTYAIDEDNPNVMPVIAQNENSAEPQKGLMVWIPN